MRGFLGTVTVVAAALLLGASPVRAEDYRLSADQLDRVTAAGGQITSIGPATAKAKTKAWLAKRGGKRHGGQIASI